MPGTIIAQLNLTDTVCTRIWKTRMSKTSGIVAFLEAGIRAENLRQKAIANNVANLHTPGYRRIAVKFEELLAKALNSPGQVDLSEVEAQIYEPRQTPVKSNGNDVTLETEVGQMVKNTLRHKTYVRLLNKKYSQIELAMNVK
jgi:flagellar basal-body rod protein FlgB